MTSLHRVGAWSAYLLAVAYLVITGLYIIAGAVPTEAADWLTYLGPQAGLWWAISGLSVLTDLLFLPILVVLYFVLAPRERTASLLGAGLVALFAVLDLALTWPNFAALITFAGQATSAPDEATRTMIVTAAAYPAAVLASPIFAVYAILVPSLGIGLLGLAMIRGEFDRINGYVGVLTGVLGAIAVVGGLFVEALGLFAIPASIATLIWVLLVGVKLSRLPAQP